MTKLSTEELTLPIISPHRSSLQQRNNEDLLSEYSLQQLSNDIYENNEANSQTSVGPGSYNIPSSFTDRAGIAYKNVPKYSLGKSPKGQSLDTSCGPGKYYDPDFKATKESSPGYKIMMPSIKKHATQDTPSPGPKYDYDRDKMGKGIGITICPEGTLLEHTKYVTPSSHDYHITSLFDDNKKRNKGIIIGASKKCLDKKIDNIPGPGSYDYSIGHGRKEYSFPKVKRLGGVKNMNMLGPGQYSVEHLTERGKKSKIISFPKALRRVDVRKWGQSC